MKNKVEKFNLLSGVQDQLNKNELTLVKGGDAPNNHNKVTMCGCEINRSDMGCNAK